MVVQGQDLVNLYLDVCLFPVGLVTLVPEHYQ